MKLSLCVIVKDELSEVKRIINDYKDIFDELLFAVDENLEEFKKLESEKVKIYPYKWIDDFSHKRNFLAEKVTGDYYFRMDTDDAIQNPQAVRKVAEEALKNNVSMVVCNYVYSRDEDGNPNAIQYRETIIRNDDTLYWNKKIHECILPKTQAGFKTHIDDKIEIEHLIDFEHGQKSLVRNLNFLIKEYNEDKEKTDPRTLAYLGRTFFNLLDLDKAIFFLQKHINSSGWNEDRYVSWCYLAQIFIQKKDFTNAVACCNEALSEQPDFPDAYFKLHDIYFQKGDWDKSISWGLMGYSKKPPTTMMVLDPSAWTWRPAMSMAWSYIQKDEPDKAYKFFDYAKKLAPTFEWLIKHEKIFTEAVEGKDFAKSFHKVYLYIKKNFPKYTDLLAQAIPNEIDTPALVGIKRIHTPIREWGKNEITIICPHSAESWSPDSIQTGIGGSEEAVIRLSEQVNKLGYKVSVYCDCLKEGDYDGVQYIDWKRFNPKDKFNILISWRSNVFEYGCIAKRQIIWLHDGVPEGFFTEDSIKSLDKIVVLSQYHKSLLPKFIPDDKIYISSNGVVPEDFEGINEERNPHRLIWASSYDRGLETILKDWKKIKEQVPDAEIHCYYGWNTFDNLTQVHSNPQALEFKTRMQELFKQEGVYEHGRIGHKELLKEYAKSGVWAYPCQYVGEIQCIALTKAVASGCIAVTNDFAVLPERNPYVVTTNDKFIDTVIDVLKNGSTVPLDRTMYIQCNSWERIAKEWSSDLFQQSIPVILKAGRL